MNYTKIRELPFLSEAEVVNDINYLVEQDGAVKLAPMSEESEETANTFTNFTIKLQQPIADSNSTISTAYNYYITNADSLPTYAQLSNQYTNNGILPQIYVYDSERQSFTIVDIYFDTDSQLAIIEQYSSRYGLINIYCDSTGWWLEEVSGGLPV